MIKINGKKIGAGITPFLIAEISANHGGSLTRAKRTIEAAKRSGADAVKIQSYEPETMTIDCDKEGFVITEGLWKGKSLFELYTEAQTPFAWHSELFKFAADIGLTIFSSPFDESAVDLLESLNCPAYKIASFEINDLPLIKYAAKHHKPMLVSTGMASIEEVSEAVEAIKSVGNKHIILLHCVSSYPTPTKNANLNNLVHLKDKFSLPVGLSDHTRSNTAAIASVALGAVAVEKHFKFDNEECGPDSNFSLLPHQFASLATDCEQAFLATHQQDFSRSTVELSSKKYRRSLYFVNNLQRGQAVSATDVRRIRPGLGLSPKFQDSIIGKILKKDVERGDPVDWFCFKE